MNNHNHSTLALYACHPHRSRGRRHQEAPPPRRSAFQRDRDRVIHSTAFRRLVYKTQVFVNHEGDLYRTRLTHSIEVAQIGRSVADALGLNTDLTEAICLAHDLGHTPFGHAGQDILNTCMKDYGGFEHNWQSLRVVDLLEEKYADFPGLNLTFESREGILKHCAVKKARTLDSGLGERFIQGTQPSLEAQLADIADALAYNNHDVDDGLRAELLSIDDLCECEMFGRQYQEVKKLYPDLTGRRLIHEIIRRMINYVITDLVTTSQTNLAEAAISSADQARQQQKALIQLSDATYHEHLQLKRFLRRNLYNHHNVLRMRYQAQRTIEQLFYAYMGDPRLMPTEHASLATAAKADHGDAGQARVISDYVAGMTDRFAIEEYRCLFEAS